MTPVPPLAPDELMSTSGERQVLETFLMVEEESARHVGHAGILREQTDGATGFDG